MRNIVSDTVGLDMGYIVIGFNPYGESGLFAVQQGRDVNVGTQKHRLDLRLA